MVLVNRLDRLSRRRDLRDLLKALIVLRVIVVGKGLIGLMEVGGLIVVGLNLSGWRSVFGRIGLWLVDERFIGDFRVEVVLI